MFTAIPSSADVPPKHARPKPIAANPPVESRRPPAPTSTNDRQQFWKAVMNPNAVPTCLSSTSSGTHGQRPPKNSDAPAAMPTVLKMGVLGPSPSSAPLVSASQASANTAQPELPPA